MTRYDPIPHEGTPSFLSVTELAGDQVTREQLGRIWNRYHWASQYCTGKDVLEIACGTGQGLGHILSVAKSVEAGDISDPILEIARSHYQDRVNFCRFDAQAIPFPNNTKDVVLLFEAIYYLRDAQYFFEEAARILRPPGSLLLVTANKDLPDFNPSPFSTNYLGVVELSRGLAAAGFSSRFFGGTPVSELSLRQRCFRPLKQAAGNLHLIPKTMNGKKLLKRLVFGQLIPMPRELHVGMAPYAPPTPIPTDCPNRDFKVIFCEATLARASIDPVTPPDLRSLFCA